MGADHTRDVAVLGLGPAGIGTAIHLAQLGYSTIVVTLPTETGDRVGECLAPSCIPLLRDLGVWDRFVSDAHLPCFSNESVWGTPERTVRPLFDSPYGHGWHIDRRKLEHSLVHRLSELGVKVLESARPPEVVRLERGWRLAVGPSAQHVECAFLVDATGRSSWLARRLGAKRTRQEPQVALVTFPHAESPNHTDHTTLVEATPDGWWYSALVPGNRLVVSFTTDADLHEAQPTPTQWWKLLDRAGHTHERLKSHGARSPTSLRFVDASGARLDRFSGSGWFAVGDAAITFDPLSGHGLTAALAGARDVAVAIHRSRHSLQSAGDYSRTLEAAYSAYERARQELLDAERRWPDRPFWHRRHSPRRRDAG